MRTLPLLILALLTAPLAATALEASPPALAPAPPGTQGPCVPVVGCTNLPYVVDESGDTMTGSLALGSNALVFQGGSLSAASQLRFGSNAVCLANVPPAGCADITSVTAGSGLTGGATSGDAALAVNTAAIQSRVAGTCTGGATIRAINQDGTVACQANAGGTVTSVASGAGLTGGPITTSGTLSIATGGVTSAMLADGAEAAAAAVDLAPVGGVFIGTSPSKLDGFRVTVPGPGQLLVVASVEVVMDCDAVIPDVSVVVAANNGNFNVITQTSKSKTCSYQLGLCTVSATLTTAACGSALHKTGTQDADTFELRDQNQETTLVRVIPVTAAGTVDLFLNGQLDDPLAATVLRSSASVVFTPRALTIAKI
ncbi:MAG TPA: hypothetical protein VGR28_02330 [Candidatus Thermoplasmatota archaeon]|jgi:hypothetical protein|nr:hypothetical protein [Candidatus Thermoplasmatota archaeon]